MGRDNTGNVGRQDETAASTRDSGGESVERTTGTQTGPNDDRGHRRAETLTREQYADAVRADGPPIRPDRDAPRLNDHDKDNDPVVMLQGESGHIGTTRAEPRSTDQIGVLPGVSNVKGAL
jgi:hypothetical protein